MIRHSTLKRVVFKRKRAKSLRKLLWPELSKLIRARDQRCWMDGRGLCGGVLQGSHIYPKGEYPLLELYPLNVKTLCWRHHWWWHHNPLEAHLWFEQTFPLAWRTRLEIERQNSLARKGMSEAEIRAEWKAHGLMEAR